MPEDARGAAETEQWISAVNTMIDPVCVRQYLLGYFFPGTPDGSPNRAKIDPALPVMETQLPVLDKAVAKTGFLAAGKFTLADINLIPILFYLGRLPESSVLLKRQKNLTAYAERHLARPAVTEHDAATAPEELSCSGVWCAAIRTHELTAAGLDRRRGKAGPFQMAIEPAAEGGVDADLHADRAIFRGFLREDVGVGVEPGEQLAFARWDGEGQDLACRAEARSRWRPGGRRSPAR